jgi:type VI secretion system protein ImpB
MAESFQKRRSRQRPTRVNISYDVEVGDAIVKKELPFIVGVLADLAGDGELPEVREREFTEITPENFDKVLKASNPRLTYSVDNKLADDGSKLGVDLNFETFDDFSPENVARQVEPLKALLDKRQQLADFKARLATNYKLDQALQKVLASEEEKGRLKAELGEEGGEDGES